MITQPTWKPGSDFGSESSRSTPNDPQLHPIQFRGRIGISVRDYFLLDMSEFWDGFVRRFLIAIFAAFLSDKQRDPDADTSRDLYDTVRRKNFEVTVNASSGISVVAIDADEDWIKASDEECDNLLAYLCKFSFPWDRIDGLEIDLDSGICRITGAPTVSLTDKPKIKWTDIQDCVYAAPFTLTVWCSTEAQKQLIQAIEENKPY